MPDRGLGNEIQSRQIIEQVAEAAVQKYALDHPESRAPVKAEIPPPLKWAGGIAAGLMTLLVSGGTVWGVGTLNQLQITVARMDERQQRDTMPDRLDKLEVRIGQLEQQKHEVKP